MRKRILSMLLVLAMVASLLPMTVLAGDGEISTSTVYFRDVEVTIGDSTNNRNQSNYLNYTNNIVWGAGVIELSAKASAEGYALSATAPKEFVLSDPDTGTAFAYILDADEVSSWTSEAAIAEGLDQLEVAHYEDLNAPEIKDGQYLVVDVRKADKSHGKYYAALLDVQPKQNQAAALLPTVKIKGEDAVNNGEQPVAKNYFVRVESNPEDVDLSESTNNNTHLTLTYDKANGTGENVFELDRSDADTNASTLEVVMTTALSDGTHENVKKAFDDALAAGNTVSSKTPLDIVGPEGGKVWVIAKITSEDGTASRYLAWWVWVSPQPAAHKVTKIVVSKSQDNNYTLDNDIEFTGDMTGGDTPENPSVLTAKLPGRVLNNNVLTPVTVENLKMILTANGADVEVYGEGHQTASTGKESFYLGRIGKTNGNGNTLEFRNDFRNGYVVYLKTVAPVVDENGTAVSPAKSVTKYYKLVVIQDAISDDAFIHSGSVIGNYGTTSVTGDITGELDKLGTGTNFAELTAVVPYIEPQKWDAYDASTVELTVDLGARARYIVTKSIYTKLDATDFDPSNPKNVSKPADYKDDVKKGVTTLTIPNNYGFDAQKERIYIQLTAPDGVTKNIYVLDEIGMAEKGTEAKLTDVIPTQDNKEFAESDYTVQYGTQSGESDDPIRVTVTVPYGTSDENLAIKLGASYGATVWSYDYNVDPFKLETLKLRIGEVANLYVTSGDKEARNYYTLTIKIADLKDKDTSDSIVLNLQDGTLTVEPGTTAADVKNGLLYGGTMQVISSDEKDVADADAVGTGYVAKVGNTVLDIIVKGDVNGDTKANLFDAVAILNDVAEATPLTGIYAIAGDLSGNGAVDIFDAVAILNQIAE